MTPPVPRTDRTRPEIAALFGLPITDTGLKASKLKVAKAVLAAAAAKAAGSSRFRMGAGWFPAGANSIFTGDKLLTNAGDSADAALLAKLGLTRMQGKEPMRVAAE